MKYSEHTILLYSSLLAAGFFFIPLVLFAVFPIGFWNFTDNETLGLANALNLAYRLADFRMYPAPGLANHPGVQFYLMSWLALALSGYPTASGEHFFREVIGHAENYHMAIVFIGSLVGSLGVLIYVRASLTVAPLSAIAIGLLAWLVSTPATILFFVSTGFESVAILVNGLFFLVLIRLAFQQRLTAAVVISAGLIGAFAYLNKLSYVYVPLSLISAIFWRVIWDREVWHRGPIFLALFISVCVSTVIMAGYLVIEWQAFSDLLKFHKAVIFGSGLYGEGDRNVVDQQQVWRALTAIPNDRAYAVFLAIGFGVILCIAGPIVGISDGRNRGVAIVCIGAGLAALSSGVIVLKHYDSHYTAGVSATLPGCVVAIYLLLQRLNCKIRVLSFALGTFALLWMSVLVIPKVMDVLATRLAHTRAASADINEIFIHTSGLQGVIDFAYRVPFPQYAEGFIVHYAGVPRLTEEYLRTKGPVTNSLTEHLIREDVGALVIDKNYFRDAEAVKSAPKLNLLGAKPITLEPYDKLIELRTVFLLIRK
jgi:hypothetical protein